MKKLLMVFGLITLPGIIYAGGQGTATSLTVSSGTFMKIQLFGNNGGSNTQAIAIADSSYPVTAPVDSVQGLTVNLATSSLTTSTAVKVDGSAVTQPVSGTITSNQGAPYAVNGGTITVKIDGSSNTVTANQGGTWTVQPGNTPNTTAWLVQVGTVGVNASTMAVTNVSGQNLNVNVAAGAVTANAGTNLNTSALALESGGNLTTVAGGVSGQRFQVNITSVSGSALTLGQNTMANSVPVTLASNQSVSSTTMAGSGATSGNYVAVTSSGGISTAPDVNEVRYGTSTFTVQTATYSIAASGYNVVIATVSSSRIVVLGWDSNASGTAVTIQWQSTGGGATNISGSYFNAANGGEVRECHHYCFQTKLGEGLAANLSAAQTASGTIVYITPGF
jgi:hypothetical protein